MAKARGAAGPPQNVECQSRGERAGRRRSLRPGGRGGGGWRASAPRSQAQEEEAVPADARPAPCAPQSPAPAPAQCGRGRRPARLTPRRARRSRCPPASGGGARPARGQRSPVRRAASFATSSAGQPRPGTSGSGLGSRGTAGMQEDAGPGRAERGPLGHPSAETSLGGRREAARQFSAPPSQCSCHADGRHRSVVQTWSLALNCSPSSGPCPGNLPYRGRGRRDSSPPSGRSQHAESLGADIGTSSLFAGWVGVSSTQWGAQRHPSLHQLVAASTSTFLLAVATKTVSRRC